MPTAISISSRISAGLGVEHFEIVEGVRVVTAAARTSMKPIRVANGRIWRNSKARRDRLTGRVRSCIAKDRGHRRLISASVSCTNPLRRKAAAMKLSTLVIVSLTLASTAIGPAIAQDAPNLVGTWKGASDGIGTNDGWRAGNVTFVISEQKGRSFKAKVVYPSDDGEGGEALIGTITPDGKSVYLVGAEGIHLATLAGSAMDVCYLEAAKDAYAGCSHLEKQP